LKPSKAKSNTIIFHVWSASNRELWEALLTAQPAQVALLGAWVEQVFLFAA
jgi:hypothetical protein